jgi:hypothetical protein
MAAIACTVHKQPRDPSHASDNTTGAQESEHTLHQAKRHTNRCTEARGRGSRCRLRRLLDRSDIDVLVRVETEALVRRRCSHRGARIVVVVVVEEAAAHSTGDEIEDVVGSGA